MTHLLHFFLPNTLSRFTFVTFSYGKLSASQADLERAAVGAGAAAFIAEWPEGWNHHISSGSGGMSGVSGGQAARIAVARALVRHPQVMGKESVNEKKLDKRDPC